MQQSSITVRLDSIDKKRFEIFCNGTGLSISSVVNMFIKKVLRDKKIPFVIEYPDIPNEETMLAIEEAEELLANPSAIQTYDSFQDIIAEVEDEIQVS